MRKCLVASVVALALILAGCTGPGGSGSRARASAETGEATVLSAGGVTVTVPAGALPAGSSVKLATDPKPSVAGLPEGIVVLGPKVTVTVAGEPSAPATVSFPAPAGQAASSVQPVVVWQDGAGGWRWLPTSQTSGEATVSAQIDHFSWGFLGGIDVKKWAKDRATAFTNYVTGRSGVRQPTCGDEKAARTGGITVTSDGGDRVKWCFGVQDGKRVVKVSNNTRTFAQVSYPTGWKVIDGQSTSFSTDTLARLAGLAIAKTPGRAARIVDGGDTLTLQVPEGADGRVTVEESVEAWLISAIFFGFDVYDAVAKAAGSVWEAAAKGASDRLLTALALGRSNDQTEALTDCLKGTSDLTESSIESAGKDTLKFAFKCVPSVMQVQMKDVAVFGAGVILTAIATTVGLVLTAVNLIVTGLRQMWDDLASFGGQSDSIYDIVIVSILEQSAAAAARRKLCPDAVVSRLTAAGGFAMAFFKCPTAGGQSAAGSDVVFKVNADGSMAVLGSASVFNPIDLLDLGIPLATQAQINGLGVTTTRQNLAASCSYGGGNVPGYYGFDASFPPDGTELDAATLDGLQGRLSTTISKINTDSSADNKTICVEAIYKAGLKYAAATNTFAMKVRFIANGTDSTHDIGISSGMGRRSYTLDGRQLG